MPLTENSFVPPPAAGSIEELRTRFTAAMLVLAEGFERVAKHMEAHPRYNEKRDRAEHLVKLLEQSIALLKPQLAAMEAPLLELQELAALMEAAGNIVTVLGEENAVKPGSIVERRTVP